MNDAYMFIYFYIFHIDSMHYIFIFAKPLKIKL